MMFFQGSLQEGIALALNQAKAVICFVRDDTPESDKWENEYFADENQFAQVLEAKSVLLRLTAGSQEAGFLTSFCPIIKFPAVVVIRNGMLREYFVPEISKEDFHERLTAVLEDRKPSIQGDSTAPPQDGPQTGGTTQASTAPAPIPATSPSPATATPAPENIATQESTERPRDGSIRTGKQRVESAEPSHPRAKPTSSLPQKRPQQKEEKDQGASKSEKNAKKTPIQKQKPTSKASEPARSASNTSKPAEVRQAPTPMLPKQYRLQVRLFDGSSVRSSFTPSQTIRSHVRPWLDEKMGDETRPYNLKHILTPLPNRTLTIAEEEQTLEDLSLGSTANLVMIPIQSYTEAYTGSSSSLPARAAYATYDLVSSAVGTATGLVGSFLGYGQTAPSPSSETTAATGSLSGDAARRPRPAASRGSNIRTLRDQPQKDNEFYNGNQLNFEPRNRPDGQ
ncbi:hypothetical protein MW887_002835 [Aspergillus wentii]|nr:hypothetical protein MW887_002835 [Aspergillus wentii]